MPKIATIIVLDGRGERKLTFGARNRRSEKNTAKGKETSFWLKLEFGPVIKELFGFFRDAGDSSVGKYEAE